MFCSEEMKNTLKLSDMFHWIIKFSAKLMTMEFPQKLKFRLLFSHSNNAGVMATVLKWFISNEIICFENSNDRFSEDVWDFWDLFNRFNWIKSFPKWIISLILSNCTTLTMTISAVFGHLSCFVYIISATIPKIIFPEWEIMIYQKAFYAFWIS